MILYQINDVYNVRSSEITKWDKICREAKTTLVIMLTFFVHNFNSDTVLIAMF